MNLQGKICLITGAGRGIGRQLAIRLTRSGATVLAVARTAADLDETVSLCGGHEGRCVRRVANVTSAEEVQAAIDAAIELDNRLDVVVNNAGVAPLKPIVDLEEDEYRQAMAVNCDGVYRVCRAAWPHLEASQGVIVNISSRAAADPFPGFAVYGATKAWVNTFSQALASEGKESGVRVFSVAPGAVETPLLRSLFPDLPAEQTLDPDEVAAMVETLLDPACRYASGQTVYIQK